MEEKRRILLVEDDPNFGIVLRDYLGSLSIGWQKRAKLSNFGKQNFCDFG